ncbi:MAG: 50S ribosomal protein L9 [Desulfarculaceae bacterium]|nr:50S ribosomal protein L9 [Desulfarculaceae bacterium]MCF8073368.1 50S ribosomal protein L9 [Desulfarculaceae bacterium]MCF8103522.1 50S ribosomal protein L9 [Desulfarculaceae bacterium]MCF8115779.1 50S ribosomal protein L9 [Desulfarculaceae bacterium]
MKVILTQEVLGLGDPGEVVLVKNGYGRNYLIPKGLALMATNKNIKALEAERQRIEAAAARQADKVKGDADKLAGIKVELTARSGEGGKLYGSVTNMQIAAALAELGHDIDRRRIIMEDGPIKALGSYTLPVKLHPQVVVDIQVEVISEAGDEPVEEAAPAEEPAEEQTEAPAEAEAEAEVEAAEEKPEDKVQAAVEETLEAAEKVLAKAAENFGGRSGD